MSGAARLAEVSRDSGGASVARIGFRSDGGATRLALLEQRTPLRVLFPTDAQALRSACGSFVARLRALVAGLPPRLPTVWQI